MAKPRDGRWNTDEPFSAPMEKGATSTPSLDDYGEKGEAWIAQGLLHPRGGPNRYAVIAQYHARDAGPFPRNWWMAFEEIENAMIAGSAPTPTYDVLQAEGTAKSSPVSKRLELQAGASVAARLEKWLHDASLDIVERVSKHASENRQNRTYSVAYDEILRKNAGAYGALVAPESQATGDVGELATLLKRRDPEAARWLQLHAGEL